MYVYKHGNFNINPETGSEEFCRWCRDGGTVIGCDHCNHVFCQTCIHRNFEAQVIRINEADDWSCFCVITRKFRTSGSTNYYEIFEEKTRC